MADEATGQTPEQSALMAELEKLKAENARLKARSTGKLTLRVSAKGACSVYGLGRWPITLYSSQWRALLESKDAILSFLQVHGNELSEKDKE